MTRAVVLGGGGPVGVAWEIGLAAGLEAGGVRLSDADLFVGTSAGSIVGAVLALGRPTDELLATQHAISAEPAPAGTTDGTFDLGPLIQQFIKLYTSDAPPQELRRDIGHFALDAKVAMGEEEWLATFARSELAFDEWPEKPYVCTAVDAANGEFVTWSKESGVSLLRAIASSCCVPGIFPPVTINGRRYIDGGMKSATNAEVAAGHDRVIVVSVTAGMERAATMFPGVAERAQKRQDEEHGAITSRGGEVRMIIPDAESQASFGTNLMDFKRRGEIADAGYRQGLADADALRECWG